MQESGVRIQKSGGFTLIELVVVIAIIAILTGLASYNFAQARSKARDITRKNDLKQIVTALETYKSDNQSYPDDLDTLVSGGYLKEVYEDPKEKLLNGSWSDYSYTRDATDTLKFTLYACLENAGDPEKLVPVVACGQSSSGVRYQITQ